MYGKDFLKHIAMSFFIIVTCVNAAAFVLGMLFRHDDVFGYEAFLSPLMFGVCGCIPSLLLYSRHELSTREWIVRKILQLTALEAGLTLFAFGAEGIRQTESRVILSFCLSVFIIFLVVHLVSWLMNLRTARSMMTDLKEFQKNCGE